MREAGSNPYQSYRSAQPALSADSIKTQLSVPPLSLYVCVTAAKPSVCAHICMLACGVT